MIFASQAISFAEKKNQRKPITKNQNKPTVIVETRFRDFDIFSCLASVLSHLLPLFISKYIKHVSFGKTFCGVLIESLK